MTYYFKWGIFSLFFYSKDSNLRCYLWKWNPVSLDRINYFVGFKKKIYIGQEWMDLSDRILILTKVISRAKFMVTQINES